MKISKILITTLLCLLLIASTVLPVFALDLAPMNFRDGAGMISSSEEDALEKKISDFEQKWGIDLFIVTVTHLGLKDMSGYAKSVYDGGPDGILLLVKYVEDGDDNEFWIETFGKGSYAINSYGVRYIEDKIQPDLSDGDFVGAFEEFIYLADDFVREANEGEPYSASNKRITTGEIALTFGIILAVSIAIGLIVVSVMKHKMNNARPQSLAHEYVKEGSFNLKVRRDLFLYSTMSRTPRSNSSSSGGGRSRGSGGGRRF